jgi:hypothetical protein
MSDEAFEQLKQLAESHGLKQVPGQRIGRIFCVRFEKPGLGVETSNFADFIVDRASVQGSTQQWCPSLAEVSKYLDIFDVG